MSKLYDAIAAVLMIGTLTTGIAHAQQALKLPLDSQPVPGLTPTDAPAPRPDATPTDAPSPNPEATTAASQTRMYPRSQMGWHNGLGAEYFIVGDYLVGAQDKTNSIHRESA